MQNTPGASPGEDMTVQSKNTEPRRCLVLQALYFESLRRIKDLTEQEQERLQRDLQYAKAEHHFWELGLGGRRPRIKRALYLPAELDRDRSVITVKSPGEQLPDKPLGDARDFLGYYPLHNPASLILAINPSAHESDIVNGVKKAVQGIKKLSGKTRSSGGGRKHSIRRMIEAVLAHDDRRSKRNPLSPNQLGELAKSFRPIPPNKKGTAIEHFRHEDRGNKLLWLARHMIDTARKGSSEWVKAFPCSNEDPFF